MKCEQLEDNNSLRTRTFFSPTYLSFMAEESVSYIIVLIEFSSSLVIESFRFRANSEAHLGWLLIRSSKNTDRVRIFRGSTKKNCEHFPSRISVKM